MPPTDAADTSNDRALPHGLLVAALALGAALRFNALGALSLYYDELYVTRIHGLSPLNVAGVVARTAFYDQHPPLYYLTALAWTQLFGISELSVRALSAVAGLCLLPVVYLLGRELSGRRVGAVAALLTAVFPLHVYYSREARMYTLLTLLATLSTWLLVRMARGDRARWIEPAWFVATVATALTHYFGAVHVFAEFLVLALRGRRGAPALPAWLALFGVAFAAFVPFAVFARYQAGHFDSSYLGFGAAVYVDVAAWLGGAHQHLPLPLAWALPMLGLCARGLGASWREEAPAWTVPFSPPPPSTRASRALWSLGALGAFAMAAGVFLARSHIADKVAAVEVERGESAALALTQGQTAVLAALAGAVAIGLVAVFMAARDELSSRLSGRIKPPEDDGALDPVSSLPRVALVCVLAPLALSLVAGLAGKPLVLVRNFVIAVPFLSLLAARGIVSLKLPLRVAGAVAVSLVSLAVASRIGALPGVTPGASVNRWLLHTYYDWRRVPELARAEPRLPIVVVQSYATDSVIHYRGHHPVLRVRQVRGPIEVGQVRQDDGYDVGVREGTVFHPEDLPRFYLIDMGTSLARDGALSRRLLDASRARHECAVAGLIPGGVTVYDCDSNEAVALNAPRRGRGPSR